ncbi:WcbI family polysaccharide biosynthesis putative acetyltransferase [Roseomonas sp. CECT 9278]|uniref:WcbI family polysaccharide biosynthesis putative acetyltransferase n=1 Tax=Roseomonas sp. CECT 9278 TaxID=2845823 RepID=UPI001E4B4FAD|nr:WcbI family polysaccharide biosynthesis putative acetyltransferase [Roseomonas sp. CECT 9278]CAH0239296.1 hypothetical protein ROS9278_02851 [Roseomonas sp. CECT 9278]
MRIVVLGNCQAHGVAHGLAHLLPEARIDVAQLDGSPRSPRATAAATLVEGCDAVFTQPYAAAWGKLATEALAAPGRRVARIPRILFRGYQPDLAYLLHDNRPLPSPVGDYHSSIIAASFSLGLPEAEVPTLFNRLVYARLGHLDAFGKARTLLMDQLAPFGPRFAALFEAWHARGPFMHTTNHPRVFVLADVARAAAIDAGLLPEDAPPVTPAYDHLANNTIWPVYPELAGALGVPGGMVFKRAATRDAGPAGSLHLGLAAFIRESYARYARLPEPAFRTDAVGEARGTLAGFLGLGAG